MAEVRVKLTRMDDATVEVTITATVSELRHFRHQAGAIGGGVAVQLNAAIFDLTRQIETHASREVVVPL